MDTSKIIKGVVNSGRYAVTAPIIKEDYGLYLQIEGVELPSTYEVDFSNSENSGSSVTMIGNADGVLIPREFIETGKDIFAFLYVVGINYGRTVYKFRIPNKLRPDRTNIAPTPEEQSVIDQAINALNTAVAQTAQDVIDADASAQASAESARASGESALSASNSALSSGEYASNALGYAESASASATASAQSASQSAQIKADVEDLADDAQGYAQASERSASASANSASQAQGYAQSASASANSASGYASSAQTSANTASAKAQDASQSATTASQKATEASQSASQALTYKTDAESAKTASQTAQGLAESARDSAVQAKTDAESAKADAESARDEAQQAVASISGALAEKAPIITDTASGAIASFSDGADDLPLKSLVVDIDPVQDLHGQDAPYPAGGGKNLWRADNYSVPPGSTNPVTLNGDEYTMTWSNGAIVFYVNQRQIYPAGTYVVSGVGTNVNKVRAYFYNGQGATLDSRYLNNNSGVTLQEPFYIGVGGNYASPDTAVFKAQLELGSTATSWSPYENICPISGWTEVDVEQSGVNVWDEEWELGGINNSTGLIDYTSDRIRSANYIPILPNTTYYASIPTGAFFVYFYGKDKNFITPRQQVANKAFTTPPNAFYMRWHTYDGSGATSQYGNTYNHDISINYPSTDHSYHPYAGRSITINLGQTVYGGKLDVLSGELVVDRGYKLFNGSEQWTLQSTNSYGIANYMCSDIKSEYIGNDNAGAICDRFAPQTSIIAVTQTSGFFLNYSGYLFIRMPSTIASTVDAFKSWLADNNVQLAYELKTPITVQLSANQVNSLLGVNNIWADSGDTEVEYRADTKLYIERLTAPDSADMIADANITSGKYFMVGNSLYKATANIANGSAIVVGTNCIRKSLSEALNEINA